MKHPNCVRKEVDLIKKNIQKKKRNDCTEEGENIKSSNQNDYVFFLPNFAS